MLFKNVDIVNVKLCLSVSPAARVPEFGSVGNKYD